MVGKQLIGSTNTQTVPNILHVLIDVVRNLELKQTHNLTDFLCSKVSGVLRGQSTQIL